MGIKVENFWSLTVILGFMFCILDLSGCARVRVEAPKEPIKVDISMRLDIYQHIQSDIDKIEGIVSGVDKGGHSLLSNFISTAYAQDSLSAEVEQAALRRKDRKQELSSYQEKGFIGENRLGLVEVKSGAGEQVEKIVNDENSDRMIIYRNIAKKNNSSVEEVQDIYAKRLQKDASSGTPIEVLNSSSGVYEWLIK